MDIFNDVSIGTPITIIIVLSFLKIIEFLVGKLKDSRSVLTYEEQQNIRDIHKLITAKDNDGMPLFYVPRSWANLQKSILDKMETITRQQERTTYMMDTIVNTLDKILEREKR